MLLEGGGPGAAGSSWEPPASLPYAKAGEKENPAPVLRFSVVLAARPWLLGGGWGPHSAATLCPPHPSLPPPPPVVLVHVRGPATLLLTVSNKKASSPPPLLLPACASNPPTRAPAGPRLIARGSCRPPPPLNFLYSVQKTAPVLFLGGR